MKPQPYFLIDLGGTNLRFAQADNLDAITSLEAINLTLTHDFESDFSQLTAALKKLSAGSPRAIGFATAGQLDKAKQAIISARNLREWEGVNIKERLTQLFACPVVVENDAVAAALAEVFYSNHTENFMLVIWGTGVGGATVHFSDAPQAEQINWQEHLAPIELSCGGSVLEKKFNAAPAALTAQQWDEIVGDFLQRIQKVARLFGYHRVVCVGGIALKQQQRLLRLAPAFASRGVEVEVTKLGENFGVYGAAALLRQHFTP